MSEPFLAEVRMTGFNFAPRGWATCDGQILPINQNQSLYSLLGATFGGDGRTTFALPDLRGRTPMHLGQQPGGGTLLWGEEGGAEAHTLDADEMPPHSHALLGKGGAGSTPVPVNAALAGYTGGYAPEGGTTVDIAASTVTNAGSGQGHDNMQPYLAINFVIALQGLFPSRN